MSAAAKVTAAGKNEFIVKSSAISHFPMSVYMRLYERL